jgi:hypothetical protein
MLVDPRLPAPTARVLIEEIGEASLDQLRCRSSTSHPACTYSPTGGNRVDEGEIVALRSTLRLVADECGYPSDVTPAERVRFDHTAASALHREMDIVPADAAEPGVWAFLTCVVAPDIACWRFPRLEGTPRNALRRLWWRAHVLGSGDETLMSQLGEDELVQIMERPESVLGNPRVARAIARSHIRLCEQLGIEGRMRVLRDAAKRLLRLSALIAVDALDDPSLESVARRVLIEAAVALGETDIEVEDRDDLRLLTHRVAAEQWMDEDESGLRSAPRAAVPDPGVEAQDDQVDADG